MSRPSFQELVTMKTILLLFLTTLMMVTLGLGSSRRDALQLLREIRIREHIKANRTNGEPSTYSVFSVSFSPGEESVAIALNPYPQAPQSPGHVLIVPIEQPPQTRQIDVPP